MHEIKTAKYGRTCKSDVTAHFEVSDCLLFAAREAVDDAAGQPVLVSTSDNILQLVKFCKIVACIYKRQYFTISFEMCYLLSAGNHVSFRKSRPNFSPILICQYVCNLVRERSM
jgi:hypothetical protein